MRHDILCCATFTVSRLQLFPTSHDGNHEMEKGGSFHTGYIFCGLQTRCHDHKPLAAWTLLLTLVLLWLLDMSGRSRGTTSSSRSSRSLSSVVVVILSSSPIFHALKNHMQREAPML
jgi:hypothetical protein